MADVVTTAGRSAPAPEPVDRRRELVRAVRARLRDPNASDAEYEEALLALAELRED